MKLTPFVSLSLVVASLPAQTTHTTTASNLQATVDFAKPGDVILVSGTYRTLISITIAKPLHIHAVGTGVEVFAFSGIKISNIPRGSTMVLQGMTTARIEVTATQGHVLLAGITQSRNIGINDISRCAQVAIEDCVLYGGTTIDRSTVFVSRSKVVGLHASPYSPLSASPALDVRNSAVYVGDCTLQGGSSQSTRNPSPFGAPAGAIDGTSSLHLAGTSSCIAGRGVLYQTSAIEGTGDLTYDPSTVLTPFNQAPPVGASVRATQRHLPITMITRAAIGQLARAQLRGAAGDPFLLFVGWPGPGVPLGGIHGKLWLAAPVHLISGALDSGGGFEVSFVVPNVPALRARQFRWQGGTLHKGAAVWGHPATESHR